MADKYEGTYAFVEFGTEMGDENEKILELPINSSKCDFPKSLKGLIHWAHLCSANLVDFEHCSTGCMENKLIFWVHQ